VTPVDRGLWICIDGVEAAGKTSLATPLAPRLNATLVSEFSDAPFGRALREAVRANPHYISGSPTAQSLVFIGDFIELFETRIQPERDIGTTVITDRGYLSKFAYQHVTLAGALGASRATDLLDVLLDLLPQPDLTIYLTAPLSVIQRRLIARDGSCGPERLDFITAALAAARLRLERPPVLRHAEIETDRPLHDVVESAMAAIRSSEM
jgi:thymidylate kinase